MSSRGSPGWFSVFYLDAKYRRGSSLRFGGAQEALPQGSELNQTHYSGISQRVQEKTEEVAVLQMLSSPSVALAREENIASDQWHKLMLAEEKFFMQKSRIQWLHLGDKNSAFSIKRCSVAQAEGLLREVTAEEIRETLFSMSSNKSPGPDGYPVEFFKSSWFTVGVDLTLAVQKFFKNDRLLKDLNTTIITLIPKIPEAFALTDFRPISCCNLVYKVISKILAKGLKPVLQGCISPNQAAFLSGRSLAPRVLCLKCLAPIVLCLKWTSGKLLTPSARISSSRYWKLKVSPHFLEPG
ncbi:PREDICTED: uncharacterized protein LOC104709725 [Camelina sativa]|uniref:Uncharacterized protein LOC104709725 n=1 Tax=Camelina sativa TaxID=90675 RepID=A0ABM0TD78_CAMSA|nr:PREDICTED: uncharacterized protein LOC104709725 [Camelina sativa]